PDVQACRLQVDVVVRQLETHALVLGEGLAEGLPGARVLEGDVMGAAGLPEPAHAVRQACRGEAYLGVAEALADLAEYVGGRNAQVLEREHTVAAHEAAVHRVHVAFETD